MQTCGRGATAAGDGNIDERRKARRLQVGRQVGLQQVHKDRTCGAERLLRLDVTDAAEPHGGADEASDERPAGQQLGCREIEAGIAKGEGLDDRQMAEANVGGDIRAIADRQRTAEANSDAEQRLAGAVRAIAQLCRWSHGLGEAIDGGDGVKRFGCVGAAEERPVHAGPAEAQMIGDEPIERGGFSEPAVGCEPLDTPGEGKAACRIGTVAILEERKGGGSVKHG